jgi:hypothetical protein
MTESTDTPSLPTCPLCGNGTFRREEGSSTAPGA